MNGTNLTRLILTFAVLAWAIVEILPPRNTPFETYVVNHVTALKDSDGNLVKTQEENLADFRNLLDQADALIQENAESPVNPYPSLYVALPQVANETGVDLSQYFGDMRVQDILNLRKKNDIIMKELLKRSKGQIRLGLDLNGGVAITFEIEEGQLQGQGYLRQQELEDARRVILNRVDGLGVAEPVVRVKGSNQIEVQMPGISSKDNPNIAEAIGAPALLEFSIVHPTASPRSQAEPPLGYQRMIQEIEDPETGQILEEPLYIKKIPVMTGEIIDSARPQITSSAGYEVTFDFTSEGRRQFAEVTGQIASTNRPGGPVGRLAIVLDGELVSAPTVRERIDSPSARITGSFDQREAIELANALNNPLAVELDVAEMYEVGPTLAADARDASILAGLLGGALVVVFMLFYYRAAGVVATLTVFLNLVLVIGSLSAFGATITLPGVAALVLTIGMAVDANILIFERIREELKAGKSMANAVTAGFEKAFSTIVDANVTTLITALILVWLGIGPVKGFGVTLAIGILSTVFCALVANRWAMELMVKTGLLKGSFSFQFFRQTEWTFLSKARAAFSASWCIVALGVVAFIMHFDSAFGIDFLGGDEMTVAYETRPSVADVQTVSASASYTRESGETGQFGEVNVFYQSPLNADQELMVVQTEIDKGRQFFSALQAAYPDYGLELVGETQIGSAVGDEVTSSAIQSMVVALLAILLYIAIRFEFGFGLGALAATVHDVLMTVGVFVALGEWFGIGSGQFSSPMIAAVLMTVGYSINDTIVVFDRIREELELNPSLTLQKVVNLSINLVLNRTVLTSLTTLFASLALFLFGAGVITDFALVFMIGILTGTFSSMFIASPVFFWYHKGDRRKVEKGEILPSYDWTSDSNVAKSGSSK